MKARLSGPPPRSKVSIAISIAVHVVVVFALAAITFRYPLVELFRRPTPMMEQTIHYVRVTPVPVRAGGGVAPRSAAERRASATARTVLAPSTIPVGIPKAPAPTAAATTTVGSTNNNPTRPQSRAAGVEPGIPDPRLALNPMDIGRLAKTDAQKADSALSAFYDMYVDSVRAAMAHPGREPGDWSWGGKDGNKWGWDQSGIHIGGITIPNVVLAALPLNIGPSGANMNALTERRADAFMVGDIRSHANIMSENEFRSVVKSIRERVDRERQERMAKARKPPAP